MPKAKKTAVKSTANGYEFIVAENEVVDRVHFGHFEVVKTKRGIMFKTYTGYHVWTSPYTVASDGKAHETSLYVWLDELLAVYHSYHGHEDEPLFEGSDYTKGDVLSSMIISTNANLVRPTVVFTDRDYAMEEASRYMKWIKEKMDELEKAMESTPPEEDLKADAEFNAKVENAEELGQMIKEQAADGNIENG